VSKRTRVSITTDQIIGNYLDDLVDLGLYGDTRSAVVKGFVRDGILKALAPGLIPKRFVRRGGDVKGCVD
jgi:hypothetical protein